VSGARPARLRRSEEYRRVYRDGVRVAGRWLVLFAARGPGPGYRVGITASRRVGRAVVRNRCKRRVRELVRLRLAGQATPLDVVVNVRRGLEEAPWNDLCAEFERCLRTARGRLGLRW